MKWQWVGVFAAACAAVPCANADVVGLYGLSADSTEATGANVSGTLSYTFAGGSSGSVVIALTNDTPAGVGGNLTGFVFNINSTDAGASASLTSTTNANFLDTGPESAPPFGSFDAGAALGANWTGGGNPNGGVAVGGTATFTFAITALDAAFLSASSFLTGPNDFNFVARFRGLANGGSDKVPIGVIPAPMSDGMFGLAGLAAMRRRR